MHTSNHVRVCMCVCVCQNVVIDPSPQVYEIINYLLSYYIHSNMLGFSHVLSHTFTIVQIYVCMYVCMYVCTYVYVYMFIFQKSSGTYVPHHKDWMKDQILAMLQRQAQRS